MPFGNPNVGETWEVTDPVTNQPSQAVVTEVGETFVRLLSRQQRRIAFPTRSFHLMWRFIQEAPAQSCAFSGCASRGYLQVNDLGRWVWVCQAHIPPHTRILLPADNRFETAGESGQCPSCGNPVGSAGSSHRELEGHTVHRCGACNTLWVQESIAETEEAALRSREIIRELTYLLENEGQPIKVFVGRMVWGFLQELGPVQDIAGAEILLHEGGDPLSVTVVGSHVRPLRVQRLGGQPDRQNIPEEGSLWQDCQSGKVMQVAQIRFATLIGQSGRQVRVEGTVVEDGSPVEVWLEDFVKTYSPYKLHTEDNILPCAVGEFWADSADRRVEVTGFDGDYVVIKLDSGNPAVVPVKTFKDKYKKVPPRRTALDRIIEDDSFEPEPDCS